MKSLLPCWKSPSCMSDSVLSKCVCVCVSMCSSQEASFRPETVGVLLTTPSITAPSGSNSGRHNGYIQYASNYDNL